MKLTGDQLDKHLSYCAAELTRRGFIVDIISLQHYHWRIDGWDFWPTTETFLHNKLKTKGKGLSYLIKHLEKF